MPVEALPKGVKLTSIPTALVGYGLAGIVHARLIEYEQRLSLHTIVTSHPERVASASSLHPSTRIVGSMDDVLADPDIGVVVIATPNSTHTPIARSALHAGKHVVIDKPFTITVDEADELIELADERKQMLTVFHNRRWDADFLTVRRCLTEGRLGRPHTYVARYERYVPVVANGWRDAATAGSGALYDLGSHLIDQAIVLFGRPRSVTAELRRQRPGSVSDDFFHLLLDFGDATAILHASYLVRARGPRFEIHGDKASFVKYGLDRQSAMLAEGSRPGDIGWGVDAPEIYATITDDESHVYPSEFGTYETFYRAVADAAIDGTAPPVSALDARTCIEVIEAAQQSAREARTIRL